MRNEAKGTIKRLEYYAPLCKSISDLCKKADVSRATLYRYFADDPALEIKLKQNLATKLGKNERAVADAVRTKKYVPKQRPKTVQDTVEEQDPLEQGLNKEAEQRDNDPNAVDVKDSNSRLNTKTIRPKSGKLTKSERTATVITVKPTNQKFEYNREEQLIIAEQICTIIENGGTIGQACEAVGISPSAFYYWRHEGQPNYNPQVAERFQQAKYTFNLMMNEEMEFMGKLGMHRLLKERKVTSTTKIGRVSNDGVVKPHTVVQREQIIEPNFNAVKFALSKLDVKKFGDVGDKQFAHQTGEDKNDNQYELRSLTLEQIQAEKQALLNKLAQYNQKQETDE